MDYILSLQSITTNLYKIGGPILLVIGTVSCVLSAIIFTRKNFRKSPCSIIYAALYIADLAFIYCSLLFPILYYGYGINLTIYNLTTCRFSLYASFIFESFSTSYLIFASIDRILITSSNARVRRYSTCRLAIICIIVSSIFWSLFHIHALLFTSIQELAPYYYLCYFQAGSYQTFVSYYAVVQAIGQPVMLTICGTWAVRNIRNINRVREPTDSWATRIATTQNHASAKDRQLVLMVIKDIVIFIVCSIMTTYVLMEQQITQYEIKDYQQQQFEVFLLKVASFSIGVPSCIGLYTNLIISKTFRNECKSFFVDIKNIFCR